MSTSGFVTSFVLSSYESGTLTVLSRFSRTWELVLNGVAYSSTTYVQNKWRQEKKKKFVFRYLKKGRYLLLLLQWLLVLWLCQKFCLSCILRTNTTKDKLKTIKVKPIPAVFTPHMGTMCIFCFEASFLLFSPKMNFVNNTGLFRSWILLLQY